MSKALTTSVMSMGRESYLVSHVEQDCAFIGTLQQAHREKSIQDGMRRTGTHLLDKEYRRSDTFPQARAVGTMAFV